MKNQLLLLILCLSFASISFGQTKFGAGATYIDDFGLQVRAKLDVGDKLGLIPSLSYYFVSDLTAISVDANLTYTLATIGENMPLYGLAGLDWTRVSSDFFGSNSEIGLNFGGGLDVSENIYVEVFYRTFFCDGCGGELGFNAGYYF